MSLKLVCVVCLDLYSRLTEHTFNSKDSTGSVQMQILTISQNAKCLVIEVVSILQFISLSHYLHEMIQWTIYSLIVKQVFPFQFSHALLVLCTPLSSAQWSYAEIRQKKTVIRITVVALLTDTLVSGQFYSLSRSQKPSHISQLPDKLCIFVFL